MHCSWLGGTAVKIQAKPFAEEIMILIDPYRPQQGNFPRSLTAHIALFTRGDNDTITISGNPFILATPGECETKGVLITAIQGHKGGTTIMRVDAEGLSLGHLGLTNQQLTDTQLDLLGDIDVLMLPVGGGEGYDAEAAVKIVNTVEPRIVIPIAFQSDNDPRAEAADNFLKEFGVGKLAAEKKIIIKKRELPTEETSVILLSKE